MTQENGTGSAGRAILATAPTTPLTLLSALSLSLSSSSSIKFIFVLVMKFIKTIAIITVKTRPNKNATNQIIIQLPKNCINSTLSKHFQRWSSKRKWGDTCAIVKKFYNHSLLEHSRERALSFELLPDHWSQRWSSRMIWQESNLSKTNKLSPKS